MPTRNSNPIDLNAGSIQFTANVSPAEQEFFKALLGGIPADMKVVKLEQNENKPKKPVKAEPTPSTFSGIKVLFNDPATIMWVNGKKFVAKAHNEPFDEEKGLLMCLCKAHGISHRDIQRMLKSAVRQKKKTTEIVEEVADGEN